jgi:formylglycine-generating enzyme required for sulfatase activity
MRRPFSWFSSAFAVAALGAGCNALLGLDDVQVRDADDASGVDSGDAGDTSSDIGGDDASDASADAAGCGGVTCNAPPAATCADGTTRRTFASTGTCASGTCSYAPTDTPCPGSGTCSGGLCSAPLPTSCRTAGDGRTNCGATGAESCCASSLVSGVTTSSFSRSYDGTAAYPDPQYKAQVSGFRLDKYEVTVGRFRPYVAAVIGGWKPSAGAGKHAHLNGGSGLSASGVGGYESGWDASWNTATVFPTSSSTWDANLACYGQYGTWTPSPGAYEKRPINCLSWYDAAAFCIWDGGFLPSEAEWNYAASGGTEQRAYPWGATTPGADANLAVHDCYYSGAGSCTGVANLAPVGAVPAGNGKFGQSDLAGNVFEWVLDGYKVPYNETNCIDCAYLPPGPPRVIRGGGYVNAATYLRAGNREYSRAPSTRSDFIGVRCARTPS